MYNIITSGLAIVGLIGTAHGMWGTYNRVQALDTCAYQYGVYSCKFVAVPDRKPAPVIVQADLLPPPVLASK